MSEVTTSEKNIESKLSDGGPYNITNNDGYVIQTYNLKDGFRSGECSFNHDNGKAKSKAMYVKGKKHGRETEFDYETGYPIISRGWNTDLVHGAIIRCKIDRELLKNGHPLCVVQSIDTYMNGKLVSKRNIRKEGIYLFRNKVSDTTAELERVEKTGKGCLSGVLGVEYIKLE